MSEAKRMRQSEMCEQENENISLVLDSCYKELHTELNTETESNLNSVNKDNKTADRLSKNI